MVPNFQKELIEAFPVLSQRTENFALPLLLLVVK